jgi:hypothetical protein
MQVKYYLVIASIWLIFLGTTLSTNMKRLEYYFILTKFLTYFSHLTEALNQMCPRFLPTQMALDFKDKRDYN